MKPLFVTLAAWLLITVSAFAGTPTQYYVDTVGGSNSDDGTSFANAFLTLKYAIETGITRDATNGDQINIYAPVGTPDDYSSGDPAIDLSGYAATGTATAPLIIRGVASDGTTPAIAYVTFASRALFSNTSFDDLNLINLSMVGGNSTAAMTLRFRFNVIGCFVDSTGGGDAIEGNQSCAVIHSDIQGSSGTNYLVYFGTSSGNMVIGNYIHETTNACFGILGGGRIVGNIIHTASTNGSAHTINSAPDYLYVANNFILSDTATASQRAVTAGGTSSVILNNYIEGYSGAGGAGIVNAGSNGLMIAGNRFFNCTTNVTPGDCAYVADNSSTTASGIADLATGDYTPTAELQEIGLPLTIAGETTYINVGAIQHAPDDGLGDAPNPVTIVPFYGQDIQQDTGTYPFEFNVYRNGLPFALDGGGVQASLDSGADSASGLTLNTISTGRYEVVIDSDNAAFNAGGNLNLFLSAGTVDGDSVVGAKVGEVSFDRYAIATDVGDDILSRVLSAVTGPPGDTPTFENAIAWLSWISQARIVTTDADKTIYAADGTTPISEEVIDDSTPGTIDKAAAGAP